MKRFVKRVQAYQVLKVHKRNYQEGKNSILQVTKLDKTPRTNSKKVSIQGDFSLIWVEKIRRRVTSV